MLKINMVTDYWATVRTYRGIGCMVTDYWATVRTYRGIGCMVTGYWATVRTYRGVGCLEGMRREQTGWDGIRQEGMGQAG